MKNEIVAKKMLIVLGLLLLSTLLVGQNLINIDDYINNDKNSKITLADSDISVKDLYYDFQSSLIVKSDRNNIVGDDQPIVMYVDLVDLSLLYNRVKEYQTIQMIVIDVDDITGTDVLIDSHLQEFTSLKYLVFKCDGKYLPEQIETLLNVEKASGVEFFYSNLITN